MKALQQIWPKKFRKDKNLANRFGPRNSGKIKALQTDLAQEIQGK